MTGLIDKMLADSSVVDVAVGGTYKQDISAFTKASDAQITVTSNADFAVGDTVTFENVVGSSGTDWSGQVANHTKSKLLYLQTHLQLN